MNPLTVWFALIAIKGTVILSISLLVLLVMRRTTARSRQLVLIAAMTLTCLLPLASLVLPGPNVSFLVEAISPQDGSIAPADFRQPTESDLSHPATENSTQGPLEPTAPAGAGASATEVVRLDNEIAVAQQPGQHRRSLTVPATVIVLVWLVVGAFVAIWYARRLLFAAIVVAKAKPAPAEIHQVVVGKCRRQAPELRLSDQAQVPFVWGWFKPVIVLPQDASEWNQNHLQFVLEHELTHIQHRDWLCLQISWLCCIVHWFNPLVWLVARQLRVECEYACDEVVIDRSASTTEYAAMLVFLARRIRDKRILRTAVAIAGTSSLEFRVKRILLRDPVSKRNINFWIVPVVAGLGFGGTTGSPPAQFEQKNHQDRTEVVNRASDSETWSTELSKTLTVDRDVNRLVFEGSNGSVKFKAGPEFRVSATVRVDRNRVEPASLVSEFREHVFIEQSGTELRIADQHLMNSRDGQVDNPWRVDFVIQLPRSVNIDGSLDRGDINVNFPDDAVQQLNMTASLGSILVDVGSLAERADLFASNGGISLHCEEAGNRTTTHSLRVSRGLINLNVPDAGVLSLKATVGRIKKNGQSTIGSQSEMQLRNPGPRYEVTTGLGDIEYHVN